MQLTVPREVLDTCRRVRAAGGRALVVGGAVRDAAFGLVPKDFDLEVYGLAPDRLEELLAPLGTVHRVGKSFGVLKVRLPGGGELDVALPRRENRVGRGHRGFLVEPDPALSPRQAAARRDFTINAMAFDPLTGELLDFFGGMEDVRRRLLRPVSEAFREDALRVLRGFQFAGRFRLDPAPELPPVAREMLPDYADIPVERTWWEWRKWAELSRAPAKGLRLLETCGWLAPWPELAALVGCPQEPAWHPEGDAWTHTLLACDAMAGILDREGIEGEDRIVLQLAALVHDLGKPATTRRERGRLRSIGHETLVEPMERFLERIGCPATLARRVVVLCRHHLAHLHFRGSRRHVRRLAAALGEAGETIARLALLIEADHAARPPLPADRPPNLDELLAVAREVEAEQAAPHPLLRGRDVLALGIAPGPRVGEILRRAFEAQLDGAFSDREGALAWLRDHLDGSTEPLAEAPPRRRSP